MDVSRENDGVTLGSTTAERQARPHRALVCLNSAARSGANGIEDARRILCGAGVELVEVRPDSAQALADAIRDHRGSVDCVILGGGDGTLNAAAAGILDAGLPFGVLPLGTANDFARSIGIPTDLSAAAKVIATGMSRPIDVGDVNGHPYFNVASIGLSADLAQTLTRDVKRRFGRLSYAVSAAKVLFRARPFHATLIWDDTHVTVRTMQIAVGNGRFYGGGNIVAPDARIDDGQLDLYSLEFGDVWRMALIVPTFKSGEHGAVQEVRTARGTRFEVTTRRPRPVNADGEIVTETPAVFTQHTKAARVYVPADSPLVTGAPP